MNEDSSTGPGALRPRAARVENAMATPAPSAEPDAAALQALWAGRDAALARVKAAVRPANTTSAYMQDWEHWCKWAKLHGYADPAAAQLAHPHSFVEFAAWLWESGAPASTIRRRLAGAAALFRETVAARAGARDAHRLVYPGITTDAAEVLAAAEKAWFEAGGRTRGRERGPAPAITVAVLRQLVATCGDDPSGIRDRALLTLAYTCLSRRSEQARLQLGDVARVDQGLDVAFYTGKSRASRRDVAVPYGQHRETCPVRSWAAWLDHLQGTGVSADPGTPAWRQVTRWGQVQDVGLSAAGIGDMVTRRAAAAGLELSYTAHGLRAGLATDSDADDRAIARRGGWAEGSKQLGKYRRERDRWKDNPAAGVGL